MTTPAQLAEIIANYLWGGGAEYTMAEIIRIAVVVGKPCILMELRSGERFEIDVRKGEPPS